MALLERIPHTRWMEQGPAGTLLHYAGRGDNVAATVALLAHGLDVNALGYAHGNFPVHVASVGQTRVLEVLCAAGASLRIRSIVDDTPLIRAIYNLPCAAGCVRFLVANGVRLSTVPKGSDYRITPELRAFEQGVLQCRSAVVAVLGLKRRNVLRKVDRWVVREMCFAIWATRMCGSWKV